MTDITNPQQTKRLNFAWVPDVFFHPRRSFQRIASISAPIWLTPLLILSFVVVVNVLITGRIKSQAALTGELTYPPDFDYYTAEQQAQYMQAVQSTQGPVFIYVLPSITALLGIWFGWLILGGVLHLVTTLFGGRGSTAGTLNIAAWASLPLSLREVVQIIYILITHRMINNPGLSGFGPINDSNLAIFLYQILSLIDIYLIWQLILLMIGIRISCGLDRVKSVLGVIISSIIILLIQSGFAYIIQALGNLNITRPFFF